MWTEGMKRMEGEGEEKTMQNMLRQKLWAKERAIPCIRPVS